MPRVSRWFERGAAEEGGAADKAEGEAQGADDDRYEFGKYRRKK